MIGVLSSIDSVFQGVLDVVLGDLSTVKTGRAKPDLILHLPIRVESYGSTLTLQELASIAASDPQTLVISPWDKTIITDIEKGIAKSDLGFSPVQDGDILRISIPPLTQERRQDYVKLVEKKVEAGKVLLREERQRIKKEIDSQKGQPGVSEDDIFVAHEELDKKTREWEAKIHDAGETKKRDVMAI